MNKRTLIATAVSVFAATSFASDVFRSRREVRRLECLQGPERLQERQQRLQGPERLQGPGLHRGGRRRGVHRQGRQGDVGWRR